MKANQRKIALAVGLLLLAGGMTYYQLSGGQVRPSSGNFVCVATGKTFSIPRGTTKILPLENPETKERTLLPCYEQDGKLYVSRRAAEHLSEFGARNRFVDTQTLAVKN